MKSNGHMKIEKGIPLPRRTGAERGELRKLMETMEKGDSVLAKVTKENAYNTAHNAYGGNGFVTIRAEGDGVRIWRIK